MNEPKWMEKIKKDAIYLNGCWYKQQEYLLAWAPAPALPDGWDEPKAKKIGFQYQGKEN
jgi:hypothetical protein